MGASKKAARHDCWGSLRESSHYQASGAREFVFWEGIGVVFPRSALLIHPHASFLFDDSLASKQILYGKLTKKIIEFLQKKNILEDQLIEQQCILKTTMSTESSERQIITIGSKTFDAGNCKSFHDLLPLYLRVLLGEEWINEELKKELVLRHPILQWQNSMNVYKEESIQGPGKTQSD